MEKAIIDNLNNERVATMEKEFNLNKKVWRTEDEDTLRLEDVKEFIRRLKEYFPKEIAVKNRLFHKIIDKLSGGL